MKSWTLLPMAWLLVLGAPAPLLADAALDETVASIEIEAEATPEARDVASSTGTPGAELEVGPQSAQALQPADDSIRVAVAPSERPQAPTALNPARALPQRNGSFEFGPLGVDSEGRTGRIHLVASGDTLWDISDAYLGTPWVWPSVWNENSGIENPHWIVPGDRIWISSTEMRRVTDVEAEALVAAAQEIGDPVEEVADEQAIPEEWIVEAVPAALDEMPMSVPMAVTGPAPKKKSITINWMESMGFLSKDEVEAATSIVGSPTIRNWLGQGDTVFLGLGTGQVRVGDQFMIFDEIEAVRSLETQRLLGFHINPLGWVEVTDVSAESSIAEIRESWYEITRGARVIRRDFPSRTFVVEPASPSIEGHVVFTPADRTAMGTIDHVYLDIGATDGLEVGSKLNVVDPAHRMYDDARETDVVIPDYAYAQVVIISTQPRSSVALVTHTRREIEVGQIVRGAGQ